MISIFVDMQTVNEQTKKLHFEIKQDNMTVAEFFEDYLPSGGKLQYYCKEYENRSESRLAELTTANGIIHFKNVCLREI
jgi:hypothetical protein